MEISDVRKNLKDPLDHRLRGEEGRAGGLLLASKSSESIVDERYLKGLRMARKIPR
ncbi:hypothetical protein SERLA73DRAFT_146051 [Serpula lacrymans var. lacrymans S7.3]|uniref:Uncharacterized protein n=1 Tax=Serpula lacrymans var. lacrymans (strain S7.3) TaxID=936435 RepID=F8QF02_SERL3|nr:hypothetical protein SERLA73DRAFT_146051 [Serpula lacrymans var. lacrymans S7.3]